MTREIHLLTLFFWNFNSTLSVTNVQVYLDAQVKGTQNIIVHIRQQTALWWLVHALHVQLGLLTAAASRMLILQALATLTAENVSPLQVISFVSHLLFHLTNPITAQTLCVCPHSEILQRKKAPTQLSALLEFHFLTILLIPKRKSLPQTKNMSWYLKMNVTTAHNYITLGKVRKLGQRLPLLLNKITVFFRLLYTLELCVFVPLGAVEIVFVACKKNDFNLEWLCGLILFTERAGIFRRTISTGEQSLQNTAETSESGRLHGNYLFSKYLLCIWPKNIWIYKNFINTMYF